MAEVTPTKGNKRLSSSSTGFTPDAKQATSEVALTRRAWMPHEDEVLKKFVAGCEPGKIPWRNCPEFLKEHRIFGRRVKACSSRYFDYLKPQLVSKTVTTTNGPKVLCTIATQTEKSFPPSEYVAMNCAPKTLVTSTPGQTQPNKLRQLLLSPVEDKYKTSANDSGISIDSPRRQLFDESMLSNEDELASVLPEQEEGPQESSPQRVTYSQAVNEICESANALDPPSDGSDKPDGDHGYNKEKKPPRTSKPTKVSPKVSHLASNLVSSNKPLTLKDKAQLVLAANQENSESAASTILANPSLREALVTQLSEELGKRPTTMLNTKNGFVSVLMEKDFENLKGCELVDFATEFHQKFPELFKLAIAVMGKTDKEMNGEALTKLVPRLAMMYGILLQTRHHNLSCMQRVITMALSDQICNQKVYDRLNVLGVTLCYQSSLNVAKAVGERYKQLVTEAVNADKHIRLIGDNLNFVNGVAQESVEHHSHLVHMFGSAVLASEKVFTEKPETPEIPARKLDIDDVTVTPQVYNEIKKDLVIIAGEVMAKHLPNIKNALDCLPKRLFKPLAEFCKKTEVIPLPVLEYNEQENDQVVKILDFYEELVRSLPIPDDLKVQVGGDLLTWERFIIALGLRVGNIDPRGRFDHLGPTTFEFFHLGMNYLEKIVFDRLWNSTGNEEVGTLRGEKARVIRNSVDPNVHKAYDADQQFFENYVTAYIVEAALDFFGMETRLDVPTKNVPPENMSPEEKKAWVDKSLGEWIDKYAFPFWSGENIVKYTPTETRQEVQEVFRKTENGTLISIKKFKQKSVTVAREEPDRKKIYGHYVLEAGLTYMYFLRLCKTPERGRFLNLMKLMMVQLKGKSTQAKYPLGILNMLFQQYSELSEKEANQVLHACFVNTKGHADSNVPADQQMEWIIRHEKSHIKHMFSNKSVSNIFKKSSALPGIHAISENYDEEAGVVVRSKTHSDKDLARDEEMIMDDLRKVRPFKYQSGRQYEFPNFRSLPVSPGAELDTFHFRKWFKAKHKQFLDFL